MNRPFYSTFAWAYDQLIEGPVAERVDFIVAQVRQRLSAVEILLLDAGCGTGTYSLAIAKRGFRVTGIDSSQDMLVEAGRKGSVAGVPVNFLVGNILRLPENLVVDAILCRGVLNDLIDTASRHAVFSSFAAVIRKGGVLVLDVREWESTVVRKKKNPVFEKTVATKNGQLTFRSITTLRPESHSLLISETHQLRSSAGDDIATFEFEMRCWTQEELTAHLTDAGFGAVEYYGDFDSTSAVGATDRLVAVAALSKSKAQPGVTANR